MRGNKGRSALTGLRTVPPSVVLGRDCVVGLRSTERGGRGGSVDGAGKAGGRMRSRRRGEHMMGTGRSSRAAVCVAALDDASRSSSAQTPLDKAPSANEACE